MPCSDQFDNDSLSASEPTVCQLCPEAGTLRCAGCRSVRYCSKKHQRQHWAQHRSACSPFRFHVDPLRGRCLVATRALQAGELLLEERPLVVGPKLFSDAVCLGCGTQLDPSQEISLYICRCRYPMCSLECSSSVWHKKECSLLCSRNEPVRVTLSLSPNPAYIAITPLRCLLRLRSEQQSKNDGKASESVSTKSQLHQLETHNEVRSTLEHVQQTEQQVISELRKLRLKSISPQEVSQVCGALDVNGFDTPKPGIVALLATASMLEHECSPNTQRTFTDKFALQLWAARRISKGEHLTASYTDPLWGTGNRRYFLRQTKHFDCACNRCSDPSECKSELSTIKCQKCLIIHALDPGPDNSPASGTQNAKKKNGMMRARNPLDPNSEFVCDTCESIMTSDQVDHLIDRIGQQLINLERCDVTEAEKFIRINSEHLSCTHFYMCDVKTALVMLIGKHEATNGHEMTEDQCERKRELASELLLTLEKVNPGRVRLRGVLLYELQTAIMRKSQLAWQRGSMSRDQWISQAQKCLLYLQESYDLLRHEPNFSSEFHLSQRASVEAQALSDVLDHLNSQTLTG